MDLTARAARRADAPAITEIYNQGIEDRVATFETERRAVADTAYDLNPTPLDVRARILTTNIDLDEGACDLDLVLSVAELFDQSPAEARQIIKDVAASTKTWRAAAAGARPAEIRRMESAFEHHDLQRALAL